MNRDYKEAIQELAEDWALRDYGVELRDLPEDVQHKIYTEANADYFGSMIDAAMDKWEDFR